jgi:hypothetical protein
MPQDPACYQPTRHVQTMLLDGRRVFLRLWENPDDAGDRELRVIAGPEHDETHARYREAEARDEQARRQAVPGTGVSPRIARRPAQHGVGASGVLSPN